MARRITAAIYGVFGFIILEAITMGLGWINGVAATMSFAGDEPERAGQLAEKWHDEITEPLREIHKKSA